MDVDFEKGEITPTFEMEVRPFQWLLDGQYEACYIQENPPVVEKNKPLSPQNSYRLICAIERILNTGHPIPDKEKEHTIEDTVKLLGRAYLKHLDQRVTNFSVDNSDNFDRIPIRLASQAVPGAKLD